MDYMQLLWGVVNMGIGQNGRDAWVFMTMQTAYFADPTSLCLNLIPNGTPNAATCQKMFDDPYYGL